MGKMQSAGTCNEQRRSQSSARGCSPLLSDFLRQLESYRVRRIIDVVYFGVLWGNRRVLHPFLCTVLQQGKG
jgi:hypothetical protein